MRARLLHDADRAFQGELAVALVGPEGHVHYYQRALDSSYHSGCVIDHLVEGNGKRRLVAMHDVGGTISHQHGVYARLVENAREREVIAGEHCDLLATRLHLGQARRGHAALTSLFITRTRDLCGHGTSNRATRARRIHGSRNPETAAWPPPRFSY